MTQSNVTSQGDAKRAPIQVMVVDDSAVIRGLFTNVLEVDPDVEVVASAANGAIALRLLQRTGADKLHVDVLTLDIQMPEMDGLTALPEILKLSPDTRVIMASTLSKENAEETLQALSSGAADFLPKPTKEHGREEMHKFIQELTAKVKALGQDRAVSSGHVEAKVRQAENEARTQPTMAAHQPAPKPIAKGDIKLREHHIPSKPDIIVIGSSTGGPQALKQVFSGLKGKTLKVPLLLVQHMPAQFTTLLAGQLAEISGLPVAEGRGGEKLEAGSIYMAPGDCHMVVQQDKDGPVIGVNQDPPENFCRPAVDPLLRGVAGIYGKASLVVMLTGMGSDGLKGAQLLTEKGGTVIAQDEATSVVWGMPGAVAMAGICSEVVAIEKITATIIELAQGQIV